MRSGIVALPSPAYILRRGNPTSFGPEVDAGPPAVLITAALPYNVHAPWPDAQKTGRRLGFRRVDDQS